MKKITTIFLVAICGQFAIAQIGIGTVTPTADLHIVSNKEYIFTLKDNNASSDSFVLTSKDNTEGFVKKESTSIFKNLKFGSLNTGAELENKIIPATEPYSQNYTSGWKIVRDGANIRLPQGRWAVYFTTLITLDRFINTEVIRNTAITVDIKMTDRAYADSPDVEGDTLGSPNGNGFVSGSIIFPSQKDIVKGVIIINNTKPGEGVVYRFMSRITVTTDSADAFNSLKDRTVTSILNGNFSQNQIYAVPLN